MTGFGVIFVVRYTNLLKMRAVNIIISLLLLALISGACRKIVSLPPQPHIEFESFTVFDTTDILGNLSKGGRLKIYFEDGDGDLGTRPSDADSTNLYLTMYRKINGQME